MENQSIQPTEPAGVASVISVTTREPEEQAQSLGSLDQRYEQLSCGRFSGSLWSISFDGITLFKEALGQSVRQTGCAPGDCVTLAAACHLAPEAYWNGHIVTAKSIIAFTPRSEFELRTPANVVCTGVSIRRDLLMPDSDPEAADGWRRVLASRDTWSDVGRGSVGHAWSALLALLGEAPLALDTAAARAQLIDELIDDLASRLGAADESAVRLRAGSYPRIVQRARHVMLERMDGHLSIQELCEAIGCSRRALQYAFRRVYGVNPLAYLRSLRLNASRQELLQPTPATRVDDVAALHGFWHFARFAQEYARMFGELPSHTLARSRRTHGIASAARPADVAGRSH